MVPQLKRRGVTIETEIEYRVGPYFILAVNVKNIDWQKLIKFTHRDVRRRRNDWKQEQARREERQTDPGAAGNSDDEKTESDTVETSNVVVQFLNIFRMMWKFTSTEMVALFLSSMFYVHWTISLPLCTIFYNLLLRTAMRRYVLSTVTDEIFSYVEEKGMEMEIGVKEARYQASFMLAALREMREESREAKKKRQEVESSDKGDILGPLLGPLIKADKNAAPPPPDGFELPENLEFVGLEIDLPVGFYRLRWAFMHKDSLFIKDAVFRAESKYDNITFGEWNKHNDLIGCAALPEGITEKDIIGAEKETSYLMPKSAFVGANMAAETNIIIAYNDLCFCIKKRCLTPDVPYGSTFVAWTQIVFINNGNNSTRMVCSVEAEFPNGPPMVGRQIKSGMRSGVGDLFVLVGETIVKYSDEYP
jgi:VAD1 Analog of StAR-related lipid transfer domain